MASYSAMVGQSRAKTDASMMECKTLTEAEAICRSGRPVARQKLHKASKASSALPQKVLSPFNVE